MIAEVLGVKTIEGVLTPHPRPFPRKGGREQHVIGASSNPNESKSKE
jgi:hypothetical protein